MPRFKSIGTKTIDYPAWKAKVVFRCDASDHRCIKAAREKLVEDIDAIRTGPWSMRIDRHNFIIAYFLDPADAATVHLSHC